MKRNFCVSIITGLLLLLCFDKASAQLKQETMRQIQSLLDEKSSRTHAQRKMQSSLLQASRENRGEKMATGVELLPIKLNKDATGNIKVDITGDVTDNLLSKIRALGGEIIYPSKEYHSLRVSVPLSQVETIAGYSEVKFIQPAVLSKLVGAGNPKQNINKQTTSLFSKNISKQSIIERREKIKKQVEKYVMMLGTGSINSEGDHPHRADDARNTYGYLGQGIKIGVLSDSYNSNLTAAASIASGNLPGVGNPLGNTTPITVLQDYQGGSDEGQAMLQIIHDIAPKAQLFFATADVSEAGFASNIKALRTAGCDIIIDDVAYFDEPVFQDGIVAQAVNTVTASGALYFSSAGNQGSLVKGTSSVFEGDFNSNGSAAFLGSTKTGGTVHNFGTVANPVNGDIIVTPEIASGSSYYYTLFWADPLGKSTNDYDLFLVSSTGTVKASSTTTQSGSSDPFEILSSTSFATGDRVLVYKTASAATRAFAINGLGSTFSVATNGQTHGHSCAANAFCVAATPAAGAFGAGSPTGPYPGIFTTANKVEVFSSDGPRRMFYNADTTAITANNFLFGTSGGVVRNKPDITAADGVSTSLSGFSPFYGTSAAAPHAGAIAALLKSANSSLTAAQIRTILTNTALDIEGTGYDANSGNGIIQAYQAMQAVNPTPLANIALGTTTITEGSFSNGNGSVEPGELGKLVVQLTNPSLAAATAVSATLSTNTAGITITQGTSTYGNIASSGNAINTATPFLFAVNSSVTCGTSVTFYITVTFGGGSSPQVFSFTTTIGSQAAGTISATLGATPPTGTNFTSSTGRQTGRINRNTASQISSCAAPLTNPGLLTGSTGLRQYDAYVFKNTSSSSQCVNVTLTGANTANLFCVAYSNAGFVPSNPSTNFLADGGNSYSPEVFSFTAPAGQSFTIVVHSVDSLTGPLNAVGSAYTLNVNLANCTAPLTCNTITVTPAALANGATGAAYSQAITATGGSGSGFFTYVLAGSLPAGLTFSGTTISGTPTQAGSFPITITANDPTGCTVTKSYTLIITGITAASITATAGTPQTSTPGTAFATLLKATVYDASHTGLPGAKVIFAAPSTGASGTFVGGALTDTIVTDANGVATAVAFTANSAVGTFTVTASVAGVTTPASFSLTNSCASSFIVTSSADSGPGTLRDIISNSCSPITVTFDPSVTKITLTSGELAINKAITITGTGANLLTVSGNKLSRIFNITAGASTVSISGLTIRDGLPQAGTATNPSFGGGGILINSGTVNVTSCVITNNDASNTDYAEGGGIDNEGTGLVTVNNCTISNNVAVVDGGGIAQWSSATMVLSNSTIAQNTISGYLSSNGTPGGYGGGVSVDSLINITNCTVYGNAAYVAGGNIFNFGSTSKAFSTIGNTIVSGGRIATSMPAAYGSDIYGIVSSLGYNLIQTTAGYATTGTTIGNILSTNPKLLALGNYGGPTTTMLPMSNSPVINVGNPTLTTGTDQRGLPRLIGKSADIGAVEVNYASTVSGGTPQSTIIKTAFANALQTKVTESGNNVAGDSVVYVAPTIGASGTFSNSLTTITIVTNAAGVASASFTANGTIGTYSVASNIGSNYASNIFVLTNGLAANSPITIFPNPIVSNLTVGLPGTDVQTVSIYDAIGRLMSQYTVAGGIQTINASGWAKGMYILTVTKGNDRIYTIKLIKD